MSSGLKLAVSLLLVTSLAAPVLAHAPVAVPEEPTEPQLPPVEPPSPRMPNAPEVPDPTATPEPQTGEPNNTATPEPPQASPEPQPEPEPSQEAARAQKQVEETANLENMWQTLYGAIAPVEEEKARMEAQVNELLAPPESESDDEGAAPAAEDGAAANIADGWRQWSTPLLVLGASSTAGAAILFWIAGTSGTAGAASAASQASSDRLRRLLPIASPLFTRFERDTILGHPKREELYALVIEKPGVTLQDMCESTGLSRTAVSHHLRLMEQQHLIVSKRVGRSRHFFENGGRYGRDQKDAYAVLHNDRSKEVHAFIESHPGSIQKELCEALDIQASVAHWHVKRLEEANLIEAMRDGRTVSYFPANNIPANVAIA